MVDHNVALGQAANLLLGYRADWNPSSESSSPFFSAPQPGLVQTPLSVEGVSPGDWGDPSITLHDTPESVLSSMYDFVVLPDPDGVSGAGFGSGALLSRNADRAGALAQLQGQFGIDFGVAGQGYALVEVRRDTRTATHAAFVHGVQTMPEGQTFAGSVLPRAMLRLPAAGRVPRLGFTLQGGGEAGEYLDFFAQHGTHFVSAVGVGDRILQVFAYDADQWKQLRSDFAGSPGSLQGPYVAQAFSYYTRPLTSDGYGNAAQIGAVTIASRDPAFAQSIAGGAWMDPDWAKTNSILTPWLTPGLRLDAFVQVVPIHVSMSPLSLAMPQDRQIAARRVFRAGMAAIYGSYVQPSFPGAPDPEFGGVYPASRTGLLSMLATPTISTFVQRFDLGALKLAVPQIVQQFSLVSSLMEWRGGPAGVTLPGSSVRLLAGIMNVVPPADGSVPVVTVSDDAFPTLVLGCGAFLGALFLSNTSGTGVRLVADGIVYERGPVQGDGRYTAVAAGDVFTPPAVAQLQPAAASLSAAVAASSALLDVWQAMAPTTQVRTLVNLLEWIAGLVPEGCADAGLLQVRLDALYLARAGAALMGNATRQVPKLRYAAYQPAVDAISTLTRQISGDIAGYQDQIRQRKIAEALITGLEHIDQNVVATGTLLLRYVQACATYQQQLADSYGDIVAQDKASVASNQAAMATLESQVDDQRRVVANAIDAYVRAIGSAEIDAIVKMSFSIASSIFMAGFSVAILDGMGADAEEAEELANSVNTIQKMMDLYAAVESLATAVAGGSSLSAADAVFSQLGPGAAGVPGSLQWDELRARMKAALQKGPGLPEQQDVLAEVDILVARGQALVEVQTATATLLGEIYRAQRREALDADQGARLQKLQVALNPGGIGSPDLGDIDLIGMTGQLDQLQGQMMVQLVRTVVIQDMALQYEFMQGPTAPPAAFDLVSVGVYIVSQQNALIQARSALAPTPTDILQPVPYAVNGVRTSSVTGGSTFRFQIPTAARVFQPYTMVRVKQIDVSVAGLASTTGGQFVVQLLYRGQPFFDLDQSHRALTFSTQPRLTNFLGTVVPGQASAAASGPPASQDESLVTPFSDWEISFPDDATNAGLAFDGPSVSFVLSFHLEAQINPPPGHAQRLMALDGGTPGGDVPTMLASMAGNSCLLGWDAVFSYSEEKVNEFLAAEYAILKKADAGHLVIPPRTDKTPPNQQGNWTETTWSMTLGAPRVQFQSGNNETANVFLDIVAATYEEDLVHPNGERDLIFGPLGTLPAGASIQGNVNMETATGTVSTQHAVVIDLASGAWQSPAVGTGNPYFNTFLATQLAGVTSYSLGTLDVTANPTLAALTPTSFQFNIQATVSGRMLLQLFIVTDGTAPKAMSMDHVPEPVPAGQDCSLILSSRVLFQHIVPQSFAQGNSFLQMAGTAPSDTNASWAATATGGSISVPVDLGPSGDNEGNMRVGGPSVIDMTGLTVGAGTAPGYSMALAYSGTAAQNFQIYACSEGHYQGECLGGGWDDDSVAVTTTLSTLLPVAVNGTGQEQELQISVSGTSLTASGAINSGHCSDGSLQSTLLDAYRTAAGSAIPAAVSVAFPSLSFFALKNLLFPAANMVNMESPTYAPGDLVILGTFVPATTPDSLASSAPLRDDAEPAPDGGARAAGGEPHARGAEE